jgi:hypothetical protein
MHEFTLRHQQENGGKCVVPDFNLQVLKGSETAEHASFMFSPEYLTRAVAALVSHIWLLWRNDEVPALYTSDAPVFRHAHFEHPFLGGAGLECLGVPGSARKHAAEY